MGTKDAVEKMYLLKQVSEKSEVIAYLTAEVESWKAKAWRWKRDTNSTREELTKLQDAARAYLDETEMEYGSDESKKLLSLLPERG